MAGHENFRKYYTFKILQIFRYFNLMQSDSFITEFNRTFSIKDRYSFKWESGKLCKLLRHPETFHWVSHEANEFEARFDFLALYSERRKKIDGFFKKYSNRIDEKHIYLKELYRYWNQEQNKVI